MLLAALIPAHAAVGGIKLSDSYDMPYYIIVDISNQILATQSLLKSANREIMRAHIEGCVREALQTDHVDPKLEEAFQLLERMAQS